MAIKNQIKKGENAIKCQKVKKAKRGEFFFDKSNKRKEPKIKVLSHELLASTLSDLMLALW
jgi:hypothetical protein